MTEWKLYVGTRFSGITVRPDEKYPNVMWRVYQGTDVSDMINFSRAKDAAINWARESGIITGGSGTKAVNWKAAE